MREGRLYEKQNAGGSRDTIYRGNRKRIEFPLTFIRRKPLLRNKILPLSLLKKKEREGGSVVSLSLSLEAYNVNCSIRRETRIGTCAGTYPEPISGFASFPEKYGKIYFCRQKSEAVPRSPRFFLSLSHSFLPYCRSPSRQGNAFWKT